jgi:hypothetical protein
VVECDLAKVEVAGSNPVSRSKRFLFFGSLAEREGLCCQGLTAGLIGARYPSGKGEVCKTFMRRFDSDPRLHS